MKRDFVYISLSFDAYENMAVDEWFLDHVKKDEFILHLYQNENAVIIGKNQNPWVECDLAKMKEDGVQLARRVSGGGAVYHDKGNINFSFITHEENYDEKQQLDLICKAVQSLGIPCEFSGRNDLLAEGKKFSGNAFAHRKGVAIHHGTLLVSSDLKRLSSYLTVDPKKIQSKGISSVRSRVCNLTDFVPELTLRQTQNAILRSLNERDGFFGEFAFTNDEWAEVEAYKAKHSNPDWFLGQTPRFDYEWRDRLSFGNVQICFSFEKGVISKAKVFTDALLPEFSEMVEGLLCGISFDSTAIKQALATSSVPEILELAKVDFHIE